MSVPFHWQDIVTPGVVIQDPSKYSSFVCYRYSGSIHSILPVFHSITLLVPSFLFSLLLKALSSLLGAVNLFKETNTPSPISSAGHSSYRSWTGPSYTSHSSILLPAVALWSYCHKLNTTATPFIIHRKRSANTLPRSYWHTIWSVKSVAVCCALSSALLRIWIAIQLRYRAIRLERRRYFYCGIVAPTNKLSLPLLLLPSIITDKYFWHEEGRRN